MSAQSNAKVFLPPVASPSLRRARRGTRAHTVASMLEKAGWSMGKYDRNVRLANVTVPSSERRKRHHGARDDLVSYVLYSRPGVPTAVVATVGAQHDPSKALPRAMRQALRMDVPLAYATNGDEILEHFAASGRTQLVDAFTSPARAWRTYARHHNLRNHGVELLGQRFDQEALAEAGSVQPHAQAEPLRYYQTVAMNRALAALNRGAGRALVQLPAGAGATVTGLAFISKLVTSHLVRFPGKPFGVVYLDDRPAATTGLGPLGTTAEWGRRGEVFAVLESIAAKPSRLAPRPVDAVVVNLAHGGSAVDADLWTGLLDRFPEAFHLGLADPDLPAGSPILDRFGPAVYRYSHQHAQAEGWLPAAAGAPKAELSAPDELIFELEEVFEAVPAGRF